MKNIVSIFLSLTLLFSPINNVFAKDINLSSWATITIVNKWEENIDNKEVNRKDIFTFIWWYIIQDNLPNSYKDINVKFTDVKEGTLLYKSLQKIIYLDSFTNDYINLNISKGFNSYYFYKIIEKISWIDLLNWENIKNYKNRNVLVSDLKNVFDTFEKIEDFNTWNFSLKTSWETYDIRKKFLLFMDVYKTLVDWHYSKDEFDKAKLIEWAISWIADSTGDKFTTYFPPVENQNFMDDLNWSFEWIWAYVDMEKPGELKIVSPISWSPAEKSWLKWWDIIYKVWEVELTPEMSLTEVVSYIKWPAWTKVMLYIKRWKEKLEIEVTREKIIIKDVEWEKIGRYTYYIKLKMFWDQVTNQFIEELTKISEDKYINKIIIDVRNNPGWFLSSVTDILSYFVPKGENTAVVKYLNWSKNYVSTWEDLVDLSKYKLVLLQNSWSASASEILVWTIKDYYPEATIIWEKSYGKWSVQTIKSYYDWSSLKYTIARWYTWKTQTWIDHIWISPDIELELDEERFKNWYDNQLEKAKNY